MQKRRNAVRTVKFAAMLVFGAVIGLGCSGCSLFEASCFRNRELKALTPAGTEKLTPVERSCYAFFIETHTRACIRSCELHDKLADYARKKYPRYMEFWAKDEGICYTGIRYRADVQWLLK